MLHPRSFKHPSKQMQRSTPDLTVQPKLDLQDTNLRTQWRTSSANAPRTSRIVTSSPSRKRDQWRPCTDSPHHGRSLSFRSTKGTASLQVHSEDKNPSSFNSSFSPRGSTMPSDGLAVRHTVRSKVYDGSPNSTPSPPIVELTDDADYYLLRSFTVGTKGNIISEGDLLCEKHGRNTSKASSCANETSDSVPIAASETLERGDVKRTNKVLVLGSSGVGKSALINQFISSESMNNFDTQDEEREKGVSVRLDGNEYDLLFFDNSLSSDSMDALADKWKNDMDVYVIIYAVTDRPSFQHAVDVLFSLKEKGLTKRRAVILVGNKSDLARTREVTTQEGKSVACSYGCKFIETSAAIHHNVDELLVGVVTQIRLKRESATETQTYPRALARRGHGGSVKCHLSRSSLKTRGLINKLLGKGGRSKSCDNLHVL